MLKINEHFRPPVGAVFPRTESAQLKTAPTKRENGRFVFLTAPVWSVPLILRSTIVFRFRSCKELVQPKPIEFMNEPMN